MKPRVLSFSCVLLASCLSILRVNGDQLLANWTFETAASTSNIISPASAQSGLAADIGSGTASAFHASAASVWTLPVGNGSAHSLNADHWAAGDYFQFQFSLAGWSGMRIEYDLASSPMGPRDFNFGYSVDGTTFTTLPTVIVLTNGTSLNNEGSGLSTQPWSSGSQQTAYHYSLSFPGSPADAPTVYFRLTVADNVAGVGFISISSSGTARIDNFAAYGLNPVPEPSVFALLMSGGVGCLLTRRSHRMKPR
jgi:hypothetical protein